MTSLPDQRLLLLERLTDLVVGLDAGGTVRVTGRGTEAQLGVSSDEVVGRPFGDLVHPDDRGDWQDALAKVTDDPTAEHRIDLRLRSSDGSGVWFECITVNQLDVPGTGCIIVACRDAAERRDTAETLRRAQDLMTALAFNSTDVLMILGPDASIGWVSPSVTQVFGFEPEDLVGTVGLDLIHPDDITDAAERLIWLLEKPGRSQTTIWRGRHADGSWRWIEAVNVNLIDDPTIGGVIANFRDITERRRTEMALTESEQRFRAVIQNSRDVTGLLDREGRVVWASPNLQDMLGFDPEAVVGAAVYTLVHPGDLPAAMEKTQEVLSQGDLPDPVSLRLTHADGHWVPCEVAGSTLLGADGQVEGIIINVRDIAWRVDAERALRDSEAMFRSVAESSPLGMYTADAEGRCIYVNERWQQITGLDQEQAAGHGWVNMVHPDDLEWLLADVGFSAFNEQFDLTYRLVRPDGEVRWITVHTSPLRDLRDDRVATVGVLDDITDRVEAERDTQRLTDIFEATQDIIGISDSDGQVLYFNRAARRFLDLPLVGPLEPMNLADVFAPWSVEQLTAEIEPRMRREGIWSGELALLKPDGVEVPVSAQFLVHYDADGNLEFFSGVMRDISERKAFEHELAHQATHDPLTGLPNRILLLDQLGAALGRARRHQKALAVLFLDLDHFKVVNDSLGHSLGDRLLMSIADRLKVALRPGDTIARFGGDEFILLCEQLDDPDDAITIARRVEQALSGPFELDDAEIYVGVSIGIAYSDRDSNEPETLIRDADAAMYRAKEKGRARYEVFDSAMRASAVDRLDIENALRRALDRRQLRVHYQPIINLGTGRVTGMEALLRWEHPERGLLLPGEFITIAEETGLIVPIGGWVLAQACRQLQRWAAEHPETHQLVATVNLSGRQLSHPRLVAEVESVLLETGVDPARIDLEITESVLMDDVGMSAETLQRLKALGVKLVIDDFGTGYSSLSYLRQFPVDGMKVDRSFVDGLGTDPGDTAIVAAIVNLAHTLGLDAIAEGVETAAQLAELRELGCDSAQGFYVARPLSPDALLDLVLQSPQY